MGFNSGLKGLRDKQQKGNYETNTAQILNANVSYKEITDMQTFDI
jgi:hypothetical protein